MHEILQKCAIYAYIKSEKVLNVCIFAPWQCWRKNRGWCKFASPPPRNRITAEFRMKIWNSNYPYCLHIIDLLNDFTNLWWLVVLMGEQCVRILEYNIQAIHCVRNKESFHLKEVSNVSMLLNSIWHYINYQKFETLLISEKPCFPKLKTPRNSSRPYFLTL